MPKLTPEEELEAQAYIDANGDEDKILAKKIHTKYKDHRKPKPGLIDITAYTTKINAGQIKSRRRTEDGYEDTIATVEEVENIMRLDRDWDEEWINGILDHTMWPTSRRYIADTLEVQDVIS